MSDTIRVTYEEAAQLLGVSVRTVQRRVRGGQLQAETDNGRQWIMLDGPEAQERTPLQFPDTVSDTDRHVSDNLSPLIEGELRDTIARLEADKEAWRTMADNLSDTVARLTDNVSELNRTLQGQTIRLAQLEGRVLAPETPREQPQASTHADTPPRRRMTLRDRYRRWRRGR